MSPIWHSTHGGSKHTLLKMSFPNDEIDLGCIYNTGTRGGTLDALAAMREYLEPEETELRDMTDSTMKKLKRMSDTEFEVLDLFPDFDE